MINSTAPTSFGGFGKTRPRIWSSGVHCPCTTVLKRGLTKSLGRAGATERLSVNTAEGVVAKTLGDREMEISVCKKCNKISSGTKVCPHCGHRAAHTNWWAWIIVGLVIVFLMVALEKDRNSPEAEAKSQARYAIEECWEKYERKSLDPNTKRFVALVCENMEKDFRTKYGVKP